MSEQDRTHEGVPRPKAYESPLLTKLGTVEELTKGIVPTAVDSVLPGSMNEGFRKSPPQKP